MVKLQLLMGFFKSSLASVKSGNNFSLLPRMWERQKLIVLAFPLDFLGSL